LRVDVGGSSIVEPDDRGHACRIEGGDLVGSSVAATPAGEAHGSSDNVLEEIDAATDGRDRAESEERTAVDISHLGPTGARQDMPHEQGDHEEPEELVSPQR
jgi:hypothetical protein